MIITKTVLQGCFIIEPTKIVDSRGYFMESYNERTLSAQLQTQIRFVQDNQSFSKYGVLRGLHYQTGDSAQAKLVRVLSGEVLDVAVDIRPDSVTYGQHVSVRLSESNGRQLFIPRGFAHGFVVLSETATFFYKCDNYYNMASEGGIKYDDPEIGIDWKLDLNQLIISSKDQMLPSLSDSRKIW
ncbi:MAG: dTDP-4-dehydrorhamnose 3,5-epimerase [Flavobacterium sp.]|nr:dTDP-4-dehydrorhamnose 3,5-epimerase [Flavobacterium sp.]